jgi:2-oxo-4-hydroxy-4-carboxy-5-ureidoimidazoline decarboxylase
MLAEINTADNARLLRLLGGVFEHSPWVAERAAAARPFASLEELHRAMVHVVNAATPREQLALIGAHPELAGREALQGSMTADSGSEQGRLGLTSLPHEAWERITLLNLRYREKFGFPCIVALKLHRTRDTVLQEMEQRLANDRDTELANALTQIGHITRARLEKLLGMS